jgi:hypothetical protein
MALFAQTALGIAGLLGAVSADAARVGDIERFQLRVDAAAPAAVPIDPALLTSVTIDICALKDGLNFSSSPLFRNLTAHLAPAVLRIGGSDQNNYLFDADSDAPCNVCDCGRPCSMTRSYWDSVREFVTATGLRVIYGLSPLNLSNAQQLVAYTATDEVFAAAGGLYAYSYGNELTGDATHISDTARNLTLLRAFLVAAYNHTNSTHVAARPLLVAPDTGLGPRSGTVPANVSEDSGINNHLMYLDSFLQSCAASLDAVTWHTYDFRTSACLLCVCVRACVCACVRACVRAWCLIGKVSNDCAFNAG